MAMSDELNNFPVADEFSFSTHITPREMRLIRESIKEGMEKLSIRADERDKRYEERFKASETSVTAALVAQKEAVNTAFVTSERAIAKAETAQTAYNERSNEFRQALDDQAKLQLSRTEASQIFKAQDDKLEDIKNRLGKVETVTTLLASTSTILNDIKNQVAKQDITIASITTSASAQEKDISKVVLYIGLALSFLFSLMGMLGMIYGYIKKG
jgi:uncharacterized phage infection (PIP) family protein YhgE